MILKGKEILAALNKKERLIFYTSVEREMLFNFNAYKLKLALPLDTIRIAALPEKFPIISESKKSQDIELVNVDTIYIFSETDLEIFDKEKQSEGDKWIYQNGSLYLIITNPVFHERNIIQHAKCWLVSSSQHLMNYINRIDSSLASEYFNKKYKN